MTKIPQMNDLLNGATQAVVECVYSGDMTLCFATLITPGIKHLFKSK